MSLLREVQSLPKTDLHCHLDGSLRPETVLALARKDGIDLGVQTLDELKSKLVCGQKVESLPIFLQAFDLTCSVLQSEENIERAAFELAEDAHKENVWHLEVRHAPQLSTQKGLSISAVIDAIHAGLTRAEKAYGISTGIIACALRIDSDTYTQDLAKEVVKSNSKVLGFDLAHAERGNPPGVHAQAFAIAHEAGLQCTVHAGEDYGPESIKEALDDCFAKRIGHGLTLPQSPSLVERVKTEGISIECCPSSNVQISLIPDWKSHPIRDLFDLGVRVTLNTDNRLLTGINVTNEYMRAAETFNFTIDELKKISRNGFEASFLPEERKNAIVKKFDES